MIDVDRITNDPTHEYYAYKPRKKTIVIPWWVVILVFVLIIAAVA
jgi:hypothetical protein